MGGNDPVVTNDEGARFLTIREIALLSKSVGFKIKTMAGWKQEAKRKCWDDHGPDSFRDVGNQRAYHMMLLPHALRKAVAAPKPDMKALAAKRAETCVQARHEILTRLDEYQAAHGLSRNAAVGELLDVIEAASRLWDKTNPQYVQLAGFDLPYAIIRDAKGWGGKDKPCRVSRATIYQWIADAQSGGAKARMPRAMGDAGANRELLAALRFLQRASDFELDLIVALAGPSLVPALRRRGYPV